MRNRPTYAVRAIMALCLALVISSTALGQMQAGPPPPSAVHIVRPGETLTLIAERYGVRVEDLVRWNGLSNPDWIEVGQHLLVYLPASPLSEPLHSPFVRVTFSPWPAVQGETVTCEVITERPLRITAVYKGGEVPFVQEGLRSWTLLPVHAMQEPGTYPVELRAYPVSAENSTQPIGRLSANLYVTAGAFETYNIVIPPSSEKAGLLDTKLIQAEWARLVSIFAQRTPQKLWTGLFHYPLDAGVRRVTSAFGERRSYNGGPASSYHEGLDFGAPEGTPVYAPAAGRVALAEALTVRGTAVI
ncbi:MAG: LysM peptidoglycan-binding domain-containing protein, partial [Anaerolineae bacterium]